MIKTWNKWKIVLGGVCVCTMAQNTRMEHSSSHPMNHATYGKLLHVDFAFVVAVICKVNVGSV